MEYKDGWIKVFMLLSISVFHQMDIYERAVFFETHVSRILVNHAQQYISAAVWNPRSHAIKESLCIDAFPVADSEVSSDNDDTSVVKDHMDDASIGESTQQSRPTPFKTDVSTRTHDHSEGAGNIALNDIATKLASAEAAQAEYEAELEAEREQNEADAQAWREQAEAQKAAEFFQFAQRSYVRMVQAVLKLDDYEESVMSIEEYRFTNKLAERHLEFGPEYASQHLKASGRAKDAENHMTESESDELEDDDEDDEDDGDDGEDDDGNTDGSQDELADNEDNEGDEDNDEADDVADKSGYDDQVGGSLDTYSDRNDGRDGGDEEGEAGNIEETENLEPNQGKTCVDRNKEVAPSGSADPEVDVDCLDVSSRDTTQTTVDTTEEPIEADNSELGDDRGLPFTDKLNPDPNTTTSEATDHNCETFSAQAEAPTENSEECTAIQTAINAAHEAQTRVSPFPISSAKASVQPATESMTAGKLGQTIKTAKDAPTEQGKRAGSEDASKLVQDRQECDMAEEELVAKSATAAEKTVSRAEKRAAKRKEAKALKKRPLLDFKTMNNIWGLKPWAKDLTIGVCNRGAIISAESAKMMRHDMKAGVCYLGESLLLETAHLLQKPETKTSSSIHASYTPGVLTTYDVETGQLYLTKKRDKAVSDLQLQSKTDTAEIEITNSDGFAIKVIGHSRDVSGSTLVGSPVNQSMPVLDKLGPQENATPRLADQQHQPAKSTTVTSNFENQIAKPQHDNNKTMFDRATILAKAVKEWLSFYTTVVAKTATSLFHALKDLVISNITTLIQSMHCEETTPDSAFDPLLTKDTLEDRVIIELVDEEALLSKGDDLPESPELVPVDDASEMTPPIHEILFQQEDALLDTHDDTADDRDVEDDSDNEDQEFTDVESATSPSEETVSPQEVVIACPVPTLATTEINLEPATMPNLGTKLIDDAPEEVVGAGLEAHDAHDEPDHMTTMGMEPMVDDQTKGIEAGAVPFDEGIELENKPDMGNKPINNEDSPLASPSTEPRKGTFSFADTSFRPRFTGRVHDPFSAPSSAVPEQTTSRATPARAGSEPPSSGINFVIPRPTGPAKASKPSRVYSLPQLGTFTAPTTPGLQDILKTLATGGPLPTSFSGSVPSPTTFPDAEAATAATASGSVFPDHPAPDTEDEDASKAESKAKKAKKEDFETPQKTTSSTTSPQTTETPLPH
ncbi:hypothetical protein P7C71_g6425, partial [Lecanoromycetidae sp. Uapishka_2]